MHNTILCLGMYFARIGIALSVLFNVILGGYSNQTFSARNYCWKKKDRYNMTYVIDTMFYYLSLILNLPLSLIGLKVDPADHSMKAWIYWRVRKDVIHDYHCGDLKD